MTDKRLLILDDDPLIGKTMEAIAKSVGFEVTITLHAAEFFRQLDDWRPSHIALDLVMPDMDGVEVLVELARRECDAHIIISSGVGSRVLDAAARSAKEHGLPIAGVLAKPFSPGNLRELLIKPDSVSGSAESQRAAVTDRSYNDITKEELAAALENREFELVYQPKVHCTSGILAGFEALVRWNSPKRGLLAPNAFISLAETSGLIRPMTREIIRMGMHWLGAGFDVDDQGNEARSRQRLADLTLSINLSARSLGDTEFIDFVVKECKRAGVQTSCVVFELTETSAMEDPVASLDLLTRLRMKGFKLSLDDFGTGYSSMLQLVRLPFSEIKVDKSFVMSAGRSEESRTVVRSIVELGHSLGLQVTAEGVEHEEALDFLRETGCDMAQGYLLARPLDGERAKAWGLRNIRQSLKPSFQHH